MLIGRYVKWIAAFISTLLVSEQIPLINTIDAVPSETSQLLSTVSEFANEVKVSIVEMITRPSDFFQENEHNQSQPSPTPSAPSEVEPPPKSLPEFLQFPETAPSLNSTSCLWRMEGSKLILELELGWIPGFEALRNAVGWFGVLFSSASRVDSAGPSYWVYALIPAAIGFFGGLGYGFGGWCRWCFSRRKPLKADERVQPATISKERDRRDPADVYHESRLNKSYMMPSSFQHMSSPIVTTKLEHMEETSSTMGGVAKKEEDVDQPMISPSLPDSFSPRSPNSPTQLNDNEFALSSYDGFQPKPTVSNPIGLPDALMGSFPLHDPLPKLNLPNISDPWSNDTPDDLANLS